MRAPVFPSLDDIYRILFETMTSKIFAVSKTILCPILFIFKPLPFLFQSCGLNQKAISDYLKFIVPRIKNGDTSLLETVIRDHFDGKKQFFNLKSRLKIHF